VNGFSRHVAELLWRYRFALSGLVIVVSLLALPGVARLGVSNSLDVWYPRDDPELISYRDFQDTFGSDEIIVVAVRGDVDFSLEEGADIVGELTDQLLDIEGVASVASLVTVPQSLADARGRLLSGDGRTTALIVQTLIGPDIEARRHQMLLEIREAVGGLGLESHLGGFGVVFDGLNEASTTGAAALITSAHLLMIVLLSLLFRKLMPVLLTLLAVGAATTWTMSLYAATGHQLNMVTMVLPTLVLVIGIADCLHLLRSVAAQDPALDRKTRVVSGIEAVIGPCFLMSVTTAAGFLGLTASGLPVVQQLGWFGAVGMLAAFVTSVSLLTAGLTWQVFEPAGQASGLNRLAAKLFDVGAQRPLATVSAFGLLTLISIYGIFQLRSDTDSIGYLRKSHVVRQDSDFIEAEIGPYVPVEFTVAASDDILRDEFLDAVWAWQTAATDLPEIGWSWSLISALSVDSAGTPSSIGQAELRGRFERLRNFSPVTARAMIAGTNELRISFGAPIMSARSLQSLIGRIDALAELPPELTLRPAGYSPLYTRIVDEIVSSQLNGFGAAIVLIVALIGLAMRSWRRTLLAVPANGMPVLATLGLMGLTGIPLDVASATIASVILGLVVDDTVHLLKPYPAGSTFESMRMAVRRTGGTLIMTTCVLASGFLVLGLAEIRSIAWFGVLTSFAVLVAILADLMLLPALTRLRPASGETVPVDFHTP